MNNEIEVVRLTKLESNGPLKARADIVLFNSILIKGMRIVQGRKGLFVGMPRELGKDGKWYDIVMPLSKEIKKVIESTTLEAYTA